MERLINALLALSASLVAYAAQPAVYPNLPTQSFPHPVTVGLVGIPAPTSSIAFATSTLLASPAWVDAYVREQAAEAGVNPEIAGWIVAHESQDGQNLTGDDGNSRGYWQISRIYHPEVTDECAYDLACSTSWSLKRISQGKATEWTTYKFCRKWFTATCPF